MPERLGKDDCLPPGSINYDAYHARDAEEIARLTRERDEAYGAMTGLNRSIDLLKAERDEARLALVQAKEAVEDAVRVEGQPLTVFTSVQDAAREVKRLMGWWAVDRAKCDDLRALLRQVEWEGQDGCCPICGEDEHHPACELKQALEGHDG